MIVAATTDAEAQAMSSGAGLDEERFDNLKKLIPPPDTFQKYRLVPADFEKVSKHVANAYYFLIMLVF